MKSILVLILASVALSHPVSQEVVDKIRSGTKLWEPMEVDDNPFVYYSEEQIASIMGSQIDQARERKVAYENDIKYVDNEGPESVPDFFDSREKWDYCGFPIRDQGHCGSCWAFGATEAFEDRICIATKGELQLNLSEQNMISCDYAGLGCNGNIPISAWLYLTAMGVPTEECIPYRSGETGSAWGCSYKCENSTISDRRYKCKHPWINFTTKGIKNEIMARGPVETAMGVREDFMSYKTGVYEYVHGKFLGAHAVKLLGWGKTEEGVEYWLAQNSWGTKWGEDGFFKIKKGTCFVATTGVSCEPVV